MSREKLSLSVNLDLSWGSSWKDRRFLLSLAVQSTVGRQHWSNFCVKNLSYKPSVAQGLRQEHLPWSSPLQLSPLLKMLLKQQLWSQLSVRGPFGILGERRFDLPEIEMIKKHLFLLHQQLAPENNKTSNKIPVTLITLFAMGKWTEAAGVWGAVGAPRVFAALGGKNYPKFPEGGPGGAIATHRPGTIHVDATLLISLGTEVSGRYLKHWHYILTASSCMFNFNGFCTTWGTESLCLYGKLVLICRKGLISLYSSCSPFGQVTAEWDPTENTSVQKVATAAPLRKLSAWIEANGGK